jgi:AAA15 family ATPase/GTPase
VINKIELKNFKNYKDLSIDGFKRINLISGMNNTGKTTILEAIFMLHDRMAGDVTIKPMIWRGQQVFELKSESIWHPYFHNFDVSKPFSITAFDSGHSNSATYSLHRNKTQNLSLNDVNTVKSSFFESSSFGSEFLKIEYSDDSRPAGSSNLTIASNQIQMDVNSVLPSRKPAAYIPASARGNGANDAVAIGRMDIENGLEELLSYLNIIEPRLRSISIVPIGGQSALYGDISLKRKIPISQMGEGINKLISVLTAILSQPNGLILIDEIENGIHYSLLPRLWEVIFMAASRHNNQLFITTHSSDVLNALVKYWKSDDTELKISEQSASFIRLDRTNSDAVTPKIYEPSSLVAAVERGWDIR